MSALRAATITDGYTVVDDHGGFLVEDFDDVPFVLLWTTVDLLKAFCVLRGACHLKIKTVHDVGAFLEAAARKGIGLAFDPTWSEAEHTWTFGNVSRVLDLSAAEAV